MAAVLSPFRRILVDPVVDVQRRKIALLLEYVVALTDDLDNLRNGATLTGDQVGESLDSLGAIDRQVGETMSGVESLRADSTRMMEHFAALQEDHTKVRNTVAEILAAGDAQATALKRIDDLWADLHRDMTALADAISRLEAD